MRYASLIYAVILLAGFALLPFFMNLPARLLMYAPGASTVNVYALLLWALPIGTALLAVSAWRRVLAYPAAVVNALAVVAIALYFTQFSTESALAASIVQPGVGAFILAALHIIGMGLAVYTARS